jgi:hypothetical protein
LLENITAPWIITRNPANWSADISGTLRQSNEDGYQPTVNDTDIWGTLTPAQQNQNVGPNINFIASAQNITVSRIYGRFVRIFLQGAQRSVVRDCNFRGGKGFDGGITFWNVTAQAGRFNRAINNQVRFASHNGVLFANNFDFLAEGNIVEYNGESGIKTWQDNSGATVSYNGTIIGNKSNSNYFDGLDTASNYPLTDTYRTGHLVMGNECFGNGGTGINADGNNNSYIGNKFWNNNRFGFWGYCSYSLIANNFFLDNGLAGAGNPQMLAGITANTITGNSFLTGSSPNYAIHVADAAGTHYIANNVCRGQNLGFSLGNPGASTLVGNVAENANARHPEFSVPTAPAAAQSNSTFTWYLDEGGSNLRFQVRYANGTLKTGGVALA